MTTIDEAKVLLEEEAALIEAWEGGADARSRRVAAAVRTLLAHTADYDAVKGRLEEAVRLMGPIYALRHWLDWMPKTGAAHVIDAGASTVDPDSAPLILTLDDLRALAAFLDREKEAGRG